jgi:TPR repeat protein
MARFKTFAASSALLLVAALVASPAVADFKAGLNAYKSGDYARALHEWQLLADAGDAMAQFNVGLLYYEGQGVPQGYANAAEWFRRSAQQGYSKAQYDLGAMYGAGRGVKRDYVTAYVWLSLCAAQGDGRCVAQRDLVAAKLSPGKLADAQRQSQAWKPVKEHGDQTAHSDQTAH